MELELKKDTKHKGNYRSFLIAYNIARLFYLSITTKVLMIVILEKVKKKDVYKQERNHLI
ncbi:hypothetical protein BTJ66_12425 [Staphylococcus edaphicus]|uniref:Uncharacterized protein n=1 Tax=Staphylococcus edaphicus TaxID=1955013 RepID=A0A2C6VE86_9STAP|nr:hypothetical protein BTJ66_12425 [Staphylococcus edaphicus]